MPSEEFQLTKEVVSRQFLKKVCPHINTYVPYATLSSQYV